MCNDRRNQLLEKAREGDACAIADLWHEFQVDFYSDSLGGSSSEAGGEKTSSGESA